MGSTADDDDHENIPSSRTPTLRDMAGSGISPIPEESRGRSTTPSGSADSEQQATHQGLGKGRPAFQAASTTERGGSTRRPPPLHTESTPNASFRPSRHVVARTESNYSTDDEDLHSPAPQSRTAVPTKMSGDQTPRVGGSQRGLPATSLGSSFGSPAAMHAQSQSGSAPRPPRSQRQNPMTAIPPSHGLYASSGSMSRSTSRARPPLVSHNTTGGMGTVRGAPKLDRDEDDEVEVEDRGQALIRKRQKERKQLRRAKEKERERRLAEGDSFTPEPSAPPTGQLDESFSAQQSRGMGTSRSVSRTRMPSVGRDGRGSEGYFASSLAGTETPAGLSPRDERRPPSVYSSVADEDEDEMANEQASVIGEVIHDVLEEQHTAGSETESEDEDEGDASAEGDEGVTLKDRQDAINIEHPFGLPIWKPALYRKSRSVTRNAESALHSIPSAAAERHLLPGNIIWVILFGWWLTILCFFAALLVSGAEVLGGGRGGYGKTLRGLAWYIGWPFGKYVEGEGAPEESSDEEDEDGEDDEDYGAMGTPTHKRHSSDGASSGVTVRDTRRGSIAGNTFDEPQSSAVGATTSTQSRREPTVSFASTVKANNRPSDEREPLLAKKPVGAFRRPRNKRAKMLGQIVYWPAFVLVVAPFMLFVCVLCWGFVFTIPMAKLTWALLKLLALRPLEINFRSAPKVSVPIPHDSPANENESGDTTLTSSSSPGGYTVRRARLTAGQVAPTAGPKSTVLLCTYRAFGLQYYKYTVGGVNIIFINLVPLVFFTIIDGLLLLPAVERAHHKGQHVSPLIQLITSQALIFVLGLASVIPLSYFIGMAVASISAQSSIGMGAVINATFGSVIEIVLYSIALIQGKGRLVEGSIVGSILAGVLLMPGASMCSGALKRKEQKFNAKSAGVTSTMLIMAIIGTLTPTMFYQTYGSFELHCDGCPTGSPVGPKDAWQCNSCYYEHPDPLSDTFYQEKVKTMMYACAGILLLSYLIGLWFSLRTHAAQIWQNPQQLMKPEDHAAAAPGLHPSLRATLIQRSTPQAIMQHLLPVAKGPSASGTSTPLMGPSAPSSQANTLRGASASRMGQPGSDDSARVSSQNFNLPAGYTPFLEGVNNDMKQNHLTPMRLPAALTTEDFTRAVAVATVSALRHQGSIIGAQSSHHGSARKDRTPIQPIKEEEEEEEGGGHEAPNWTRGLSAGVLLACTVLYAMVAEILVDVVDVILEGSGLDEKFLGLSLFALVPNTTEFMNAMSFAMNGNIALSMEIGSAYALQVCLLQIPAMVAFSALYDPGNMGEQVDTFTLIFPRWDVIAIILSIFLLTYTYIEARSNYHRGSILVLAYIVLMMGFYYAPARGQGDTDTAPPVVFSATEAIPAFFTGVTKLWA